MQKHVLPSEFYIFLYPCGRYGLFFWCGAKQTISNGKGGVKHVVMLVNRPQRWFRGPPYDSPSNFSTSRTRPRFRRPGTTSSDSSSTVLCPIFLYIPTWTKCGRNTVYFDFFGGGRLPWILYLSLFVNFFASMDSLPLFSLNVDCFSC